MVLASKPGKGSKGLPRLQRPSESQEGCWTEAAPPVSTRRNILWETTTRTAEKGTGTGQNTHSGSESASGQSDWGRWCGASSRKRPWYQGQALSACLRVVPMCWLSLYSRQNLYAFQEHTWGKQAWPSYTVLPEKKLTGAPEELWAAARLSRSEERVTNLWYHSLL